MANEEVFYSALHWAKKAEASAKLASELAQSGGKLIQLGFDGAMEDGVLVFKHAPGGVEVSYQLVDDVEYELDLAYNGDLDSLTTMVVKNGADNITFVSALHRSSTEPARVADMDAVMRHDTTTGYRWLFKAAYKVTPSGAKVFLLYPVVSAKDYSDKTNCITEIPQDIKLELNDGTLTLKAGSKVYVPNGVGKFDIKTISSDRSITNLTYNTTYLLFTNTDATFLFAEYVSSCSSGTTQPSGTWKTWYDTTNNRVKRFGNVEGTVLYEGSLPIAIFTVSNGTITSIDQVFNGFGYIGSTIFALPGVKGLIPNGRNDDGTLKNTETTANRVLTYTNTDTLTGNYYIQFRGNFISRAYANPTSWRYDEERNIILWNNTAKQEVLFAGNLVLSSGRVESLTPKTAFHALDYKDSSTISGWAMPSSKYIDLNLGASGSTYTAPANGWFYISKKATAANQEFVFENKSSANFTMNQDSVSSGRTIRLTIGVKKGDIIYSYYTLGGSTDYFRFIYAEGEK